MLRKNQVEQNKIKQAIFLAMNGLSDVLFCIFIQELIAKYTLSTKHKFQKPYEHWASRSRNIYGMISLAFKR